MTFEQLGLIQPILKALKTEGYTLPTPIQQQAIPVALQGKDILGCAQTGTGKTAAFAIPMLQLLSQNRITNGYRYTRGLILTPTRELAVQIDESFTSYGKHTGLHHEVIFGGVPQHSQVLSIRNGVDILVATPGRLLDLIDQGHVHLDDIEIFVLDEADRMLDMGFINDVKKIVRLLPRQKQTLFFSATMPPQIQTLANALLQQPVQIEVTPVSSTVETIEQAVYMVDKKDKPSLLLHLITEKNITRSLVFARTKHGADRLAKALNSANIKADAIHGDKAQNARQRALLNFKAGKLKVLVATDIAARGIDVDNLTHVINYDLPNVPETYVHRIGRTGRAGASGIALSFCDREEKVFLRDIIRLTAQAIPVQEEHPYKLMRTADNFRPAGNRNNSNTAPSYNSNRNTSYNKRRGPLVNV